MKQEEKQLLLRDLCARLPYGVKASYYGAEEECEIWDEVEGIVNNYVEIGQYSLPIEAVKPYLFPLSSMTKEQEKELTYIIINDLGTDMLVIDWYNKNHFDYRHLIERNLAIDCTNLNIY